MLKSKNNYLAFLDSITIFLGFGNSLYGTETTNKPCENLALILSKSTFLGNEKLR
jgi:hypothetical protein